MEIRVILFCPSRIIAINVFKATSNPSARVYGSVAVGGWKEMVVGPVAKTERTKRDGSPWYIIWTTGWGIG
jgi:hypothetical protein